MKEGIYMKNKRKIRVMAWILTVVMLMTSLGLDALPVMAAPVEGLTYDVSFDTSFTTAEMTFTLQTIGDEAPSGSNNVDIFIKPSGVNEYQQIGWYEGLTDNRLVFSDIKYQYQPLTPGTTYDVEIVLRHDNQTIGAADTSFTTKPVTITCEEKQITWFSAEYSLSVAQKEELVAAGITTLKAYPYIQEKGGELVKANVGGDGIDVLNGNMLLRNLKDDTEYTVYFAGLRDKAEPCLSQFTFRTSKDTRNIKLLSDEIQYCYADFTVAVTGGRDDVETKSYLFLRKKGETGWRNQKQSDAKEAFTKEFRMNELEPVTEYEYALAIGDDWNINDPDQITKDGHKITGSFTTPDDPRELTSVCSAGYRTALIRAGYTGNNLNGVMSAVHVFVREKGTEKWTEKKDGSYDTGNSFDFVFTDLKEDTEYEYRIILNSKWDGTTADDSVRPLQYNEGSFKTDVCRYTLKVTPDTEKSLYNKEYLQVQLEGSKQDRSVTLELHFNNDAEKTVSLYRDEAYKDTFSIKGLASDTTYYVTEYSLYVDEFGEHVCIKQAACGEEEYSFHTPAATAPDYVKFEKEEIYLNASQAEEENVGNVTLKPLVNDGASDEMLWESKNPEVATVDENGKVTAAAVGETEITATSKYNKEVTATVKVFVDSVEAVYAENGNAVGDEVVKGLKGTQSEAIVLTRKNAETGETENVPVTGYAAERSSVVNYDIKTNTITFGTVGTAKLYLYAGEYKVRIQTESYVRTAGFYVSSLSNDRYPAVESTENTYDIAANQSYQINLKALDGSDITDYSKFKIVVENDANGCVEADGDTFILTAKSVTAASVKITVSPKAGTAYDNEYYEDAVFYVNVKALPEENEPDMYVYTNVDKFLSDVDLKDGWKWENEKLALYVLRKTQTYDFTAYYAGDDKYPATQTIKVALAEVSNLTVEDVSRTGYHVTADGTDKILVKVSFSYAGEVKQDDLSAYLKADGEDCVIACKEYDNGYAIYEVSAKKAGNYVLEAGVQSGLYGSALTGKTIVLQATEEPCVRSIKVQNTSVEPAEFLEDDEILLDASKDIKTSVNLKAVTYDYTETEMTAPKLIWTSTDKSVVQVTADKKDTQKAVLLVKGEGNAVITVKSADAAGASYSFAVEVKNLAPRVEGTRVSVNTALDYTVSEGRSIAYRFYGYTEIVEAYDNAVTDWAFYKKTQKTFEKEKEAGLQATDFTFYERQGEGEKKDILAMPVNPDLKSGKYELWLAVTTEAGEEVYSYPVTVTVINKNVKVSAVSDNINLFYMVSDNGNIMFTFNGDYIDAPTVNWTDDADKALGFNISKYVYYDNTKKKWCANVDTTELEMEGKAPAAGTATGTLELTFRGYRNTVKVNKFKIKYCYKLPNIVTMSAATVINTECGIDKASFYLYQKDAKMRITYKNEENKYCYSSYKCNIEEVELAPTSYYSEYMEYVYTGVNKKENVVITLRSDYWREKVEVKHTINNVAPVLILEKPAMTFNWNLPGTDTTVFKVRNAQNGAVLKDVIITGKNAAAQKLLDENVFTFSLKENKYLDVKLNSLQALNKKFKDGSYGFTVTPVFVSSVTGKEVTGKPCVLTVKTTSKAPEVNLSASGSIDIARYPMYDNWEFYKNAVKLKYSFKNVNSNYEEIGREVIGDYADYFEIWWSDPGQGFYLKAKRGMEGRLKAGFVYNVQIKFTLKMKDGTTTEIITKKPYKLKLKQSATGVKVTTKPQTMFASNEEVTRVYELRLNGNYYRIEKITGGLDVNKDGKNDIVIDRVSTKDWDTAADITLRIADRDAISATVKGKSYSVPIEIMVMGADGVTKNIRTQIKVTVRK